MIAHSVEHFAWNTVFRPILTLNLTEISAWNIMFHGALFNYKWLILCMLLGWFLCAGLLNKKVHFPDAKVRVILTPTIDDSKKRRITPFYWTRRLVLRNKNHCFLHQWSSLFSCQNLRYTCQIAHSLCHCGLDPQSHNCSIQRNTLRPYSSDRMRCRVKPGRTRLLQKTPFFAPKKCSTKVNLFVEQFSPVF